MISRRVDGPFGVEFHDVDVAAMSDARVQEARRAWNAHGLIFFRDQALDCDQYIAFAKRWGDIVVNRFFERVEGYEEIAMVRKEPSHKTVVGQTWHTDHSYDPRPARGSMLYARETPKQGGDTLFVSTYLAYETLPDELKREVEGLRALHSSRHVFSKQAVAQSEAGDDRYHNAEQAVQDSIHPVVIVHPESGRGSLYVNPNFTVRFEDRGQEESEPLLQRLYAHATRPEFITRFNWRPGTIALWDNLATWHQAQNDYPNERRVMHRITLAGDAPRGYRMPAA